MDVDPEIVVALVFHWVFWSVMLLLIEFRFFQHIRLKAAGYWKTLIFKTCGKRPKTRSLSLGRKTFNIQSLFIRRRSVKKVPSQLLWVDPGISEHLAMLQSTSNDVGMIRMVGVDYGDADYTGPPRLNLLIKKGECYCFVDTEKSTASRILKLLSGRSLPFTGKIIVKGQHFVVHGKPSYTPIGYCMEIDSVVGVLTAREVLIIHAKLRGIKDKDLDTVVDSVLKTFNLLDKADIRSAKFSSSDQRLLNIAVAVVGDPEIILLDDPFGNLDVVNKSLVWKALDKSVLSGSTIIMCSDKIREISDKVTVVVILLNGEPVCIGSPETIRNRYCGSYTLLAKLDVCNRNLPIEALITSLKERFPKCVIFYDHQDFLHMRIPYDDTTLPDVFALMESAKKHLKIHSYKLVHTNLAYVITAMQQRLIEESTVVNECDDCDDDDDFD
ncbi:unnamed protein product [Candidula unifasciata]|uniref:ABC transporter domain-containing protein n=1 Tax=Candidula unifasciata TaxID=100452 RepID=A0A8S3ZT18_9EUPU|nr:unnamed protein product [Candidula unifasciata]